MFWILLEIDGDVNVNFTELFGDWSSRRFGCPGVFCRLKEQLMPLFQEILGD